MTFPAFIIFKAMYHKIDCYTDHKKYYIFLCIPALKYESILLMGSMIQRKKKTKHYYYARLQMVFGHQYLIKAHRRNYIQP